MTTAYPAALDTLTNPTGSDNQSDVGVLHSSQHANANDAIEAIETELGVLPKGSAATVAARIARPTSSEHAFTVYYTPGLSSSVVFPPFKIRLASGETRKLTRVSYWCETGSLTMKIQKATTLSGVYSDLSGFTGISVTNADGDLDPADYTVVDSDCFKPVITANTGTVTQLSFTLHFTSEK